MESLPEEITHEEILPRLPVKSLLRFKCVSKSWRSLINSKRFINTHLQNSKKDPSFLKQLVILANHHLPKQRSLPSLWSESPSDPSPLEDPTISSLYPFDVVGCYNGLICIRKYMPNRILFYLWNPSTRISKKLPGIVCGFHVENCGFGWDESSGEYKVFALLSGEYKNYWCRVYSSKTKSWKRIKYNFKVSPDCFQQAGVFVGGKLHWRDFGERYNDIVFFDLKSEVFGRIEIPFEQENRYRERLGQIGGCLCMLDYRCMRDIQVWVMKESWERLVYLSLDHELLQLPLSASSFTHKGSNGEIFVFDGSTFLVYHPTDNVFRFPINVSSWHYGQHVYVENLLSP